MNIFYLDRDPRQAAMMHVDQHVLKQILEYAQLLDTARTVSIVPRPKSTFNNPCAVWVRQSRLHYRWVYLCFKELLHEYSHRFGKPHAYNKYIVPFGDFTGLKFLSEDWTDPPRVMPTMYHKFIDSALCYRAYYRYGKRELHRWTKRPKPMWINNDSSLQVGLTK